MDGERILVDRLGGVDRAELEGERERTGRGVKGIGLVVHPVEGELDRLGVDVRAVVIFDALADLERVGLAVVADRPRRGEAGLDVEGAVLVVQEPVIHVAEDAEVADRHGLRRVERLQLGDMADDEDVFRRLRAGGRRHADRDRHSQRRNQAAIVKSDACFGITPLQNAFLVT